MIRYLCNIVYRTGKAIDAAVNAVAGLFRRRCAICHRPITSGQLTARALHGRVHRYCSPEHSGPERRQYAYHDWLRCSALRGREL